MERGAQNASRCRCQLEEVTLKVAPQNSAEDKEGR
jgi:hypothetical protein